MASFLMVGKSTKRLESLRAIKSDARKKQVIGLGKVNIGVKNILSIPSSHGAYTAVLSNCHRAVTWIFASIDGADARLCSR